MAELKIKADSGGGTVSLKGPSTTTSNAAVQLTLPQNDGDASQYLQTNGSGVLSWATVSSDPVTTSGTNNFTVADGNLVIGTAGHGIDFSATGDSGATGISNMSEVLDDYEEGDWDPTLPDSDGGIGSVAGWYAKIGKVVCVQFGFVCLTNSDSSGFKVAGFPFTNNGYSTMSIVSEANQGGSGLALKMTIGQSYGHIVNQENDEKTYSNFSNCWIWGAGNYMTTS